VTFVITSSANQQALAAVPPQEPDNLSYTTAAAGAEAAHSMHCRTRHAQLGEKAQTQKQILKLADGGSVGWQGLTLGSNGERQRRCRQCYCCCSESPDPAPSVACEYANRAAALMATLCPLVFAAATAWGVRAPQATTTSKGGARSAAASPHRCSRTVMGCIPGHAAEGNDTPCQWPWVFHLSQCKHGKWMHDLRSALLSFLIRTPGVTKPPSDSVARKEPAGADPQSLSSCP